jgi:hypothetical protein
MGVFKEHAHAFEAIARKQERIWNDACDFGYAYNTGNIPKEIELLIHYANDLKDSSLMRKRIANPLIGHVSLTFRIGWEIDEGMECGTQYIISCQNLSKRMRNGLLKPEANRFISVEIEPYREPYRNR